MNKCRRKRPTYITAVALIATLVPIHTYAVDNSDSLELEEVVVTALKRSTSLQETPLSISAVSGEKLEVLGADDFIDYVSTVPGLSIVDNGPGERRLVIRGINGVGEAQVGLYYDETFVTGAPGAESDSGARQPDFKLIDIERVEVLKGPQGTLYGAGSVGGTLRVITQKPKLNEFSGFFGGDVSSTSQGGEGYGTEFMFNAPLVDDKVGLRVVGYYRDDDGFIDNVPLGKDNINDENSWGTRMALRWEASENIIVDGRVMVQKTDSGGRPEYFPATGELKTDRVTVENLVDDTDIYNLSLDWDFGFATLVATTSYYERFIEHNFDTTPFIAAFDNNTICAIRLGQDPTTYICTPAEALAHTNLVNGFLPATVKQPQNVENWTHEIRLSSNSEGPLNWTFGLFSEDRESDLKSQVLAATPIGKARVPFEYIFFREAFEEIDQISVFGEVSYDLTEQLTISAGLRWYDYDKTNKGVTHVGFTLVNAPAGSAPDGDAGENGSIFRGNISYQLNDDIMIYGQVAEGFRLGGANQSVFVEVPAQFGSDSVTNYEIGAKTEWMDNQVTLNVALFRMVWEDMQVGGATPDGAFSFIGNAGEAEVDGLELEFNAQFVEGLLVSGGLTFQNAELSEDQIDENGDFTAPGVDGDKIPRVADLMYNLAVEYRWTILGDVDNVARIDYSYMDDRNATLSKSDPFFLKIDDYSLVNVRLGVEYGAWSGSLYVKNVADERAQSNRAFDDFTNRSIFTLRPRTVGLEVKRTF